MQHNTILSALLALDSLSVYRQVLEDSLLSRLGALLTALNKPDLGLREAINAYQEFYFELAKKSKAMSLRDYVLDLIIFDENPFSFQQQAVQRNDSNELMEKAAAQDLNGLQLIAQLESAFIKENLAKRFENHANLSRIEELPEWITACNTETLPSHLAFIKERINSRLRWRDGLIDLKHFHQQYGCGLFARYFAFVWERSDGSGYIRGIDRPDSITFNDLVEYQSERSRVIENTVQFLNGFPANNVLLYGDRGSGKSSTVKAILNEYHTQGLRMLEIPKAYLADFPQIIRQLKDRSQKFILYVDDLVFGDNEENYTSLKAVLEGGLESKTPNILIYATSNRRHLVKEYFQERAGLHSNNPAEEVHAGDTMQEKLSLADRFGINVVFTSPNQAKYLQIVTGIAARRNLAVDQSRLHKEALQWALWYNGRSARTARQFVDWFEGQLNLPDA